MSSQAQSKGDVLQRIGGVGLVLGGILIIVGNVIFPRADDPASAAATFKAYGENPDMTRIAVLLVLLGEWAVLGGIAAVYRSITTGAGSAWSRLGFYGYVIATAIFNITLVFVLAATTASEKGPTAVGIGLTMVTAANSLLAVSVLTYWLSFALLGISISVSTVFPKWVGWVAVLLGVATVAVIGVPYIFMDQTKTLQTVFMILALLSAIWTLGVGALIVRREMKAM